MNNATNRLLIAAALAYLVVAVITFGHAAANSEREADANYAQCMADERQQVCLRSIDPPFAGIMAGALWPLYWSWEAWS